MTDAIFAVSPIDGRYLSKTNELRDFFSEFALIKYRIRIEIEYFIFLSKNIPKFDKLNSEEIEMLRSLYIAFDKNDALRVKEIEKTTNHDVKAVEYFIKEKIVLPTLADKLEFIHFGLTSQDINNTAIPLSIKEFIDFILMPKLNELQQQLAFFIDKTKDISLLAYTHGQPASPTKLGKEMKVFWERIGKQMMLLTSIPHSAKFGGATGNFNAHLVAYPSVNWLAFGNEFVNGILGLNRSQTTTQVEHYDNMAALFQNFGRINTILIDFCRDIWTYVSMNYFKQKLKEGEIGSSAMPHKVNPIDFENAEGNLGLANAIFHHLAEKLPVSRLQRDLTDSTVLRNVGVPFGHTVIAIDSILKGLGKLIVNEKAIQSDLEDNWMVVAEGIQTILRREGFEKPYEALKDLTRTNEAITQNTIHAFIDQLKIAEEVKNELKKITPANYTGLA